jgi:hypothetical protein
MATLTRLEKLRNRRIDPLIKVGELNEAYARLPKEDTSIQYAIGAMQPIDPAYTKNTLEERSRVEKQLNDGYRGMELSIQFDYQGSVTNDTHIRAHSDVDLLTVEQRFIAFQPPNYPTSTYQGDAVADLRQIRRGAVSILKASYPTAKVDETGSKAINISGGSLRRKIDVIASNWWHTNEYLNLKQKHWLGIEILDNDKGIRIQNKPFLHNKRIEDRDTQANGGLRKLIRLLKSLKYDSDEAINLSSYDIAGIVYNMKDSELYAHPGQDLLLINHCHIFLLYLEIDNGLKEKILVPNETRKVFCEDGATKKGLQEMRVALGVLLTEIEQGLNRSFKKLAEARITY